MRHRNNIAWQKCIALIIAVYRATKTFPVEEKYGVTAQLRRAAVSAASNIAEGCARYGSAEFAHKASIALGELAEVDTLLFVSHAEQYLPDKLHAELEALLLEASAVTLSLEKSLRAAAA